jgi:prevent-host-death family protein
METAVCAEAADAIVAIEPAKIAAKALLPNFIDVCLADISERISRTVWHAKRGSGVGLASGIEMTILTIMVKPARNEPNDWTVAEAKARFSELVEKSRTAGPQLITKNGRKAAVVVSAEEWERKTRRAGTLADFFAASPLRDSGLEIVRRKERPRKTRL